VLFCFREKETTKMAFVRTVKRENPFVQMDKYFLEDDNLQWESKGLLGYILSRPDNWKINQTDLVKRSAGGKGKVESALLDLMANGYVHWYAVRNDKGQIEEWVYDVYERPEFNPNKDECIAEGKRRIEEKKSRNKRKNEKNKSPEPDKPKVGNPETDNPEVGNPEVDNPHYNNNDFNNIDLTNNKSSSSSRDSIDSELKLKYPNAPFDEVKESLLNDSTAVINTDKQYKSMLEYRLKNWAPKPPKQQTKRKKPIRTEKLPDWYNEDEEQTNTEEQPLTKAEIDEMLKKLRSDL